MSTQRIKAIILQELYITKNSLEIIIDLFYFSVITIVVFGLVSVYLTGSSLSAAEFLKELVNFFPFKIEAVQTDNGSEYLLNFHKQCEELGIKHFFTDPRCPKQNGRVERFIQTATYEFFNWQYDLVDDIQMIKEKCIEFNLMYNTKRYHQTLKYKTPIEYLEELTTKGELIYNELKNYG